MNVGKIENLQRFFWPPVENDDYLAAASYRALAIFSIVGFLIGTWVATKYALSPQTDLTPGTELMLFSFPVFLLFPFLLYRRVSVKMVGRAFTIYTVLRLAVLAVSLGGIDSSQSLFLIPVVLIATFVLGGKEGFIGTFATIFVYIGLFIGERSHLSSPVELAELTQHFTQLVAVLLMVVGAGATFRHQLVMAVDDLVVAKANADASNLAKSEFLANMSHEIRTPMNGVLGMADVLKVTKLTPKQQMLVHTIDRSGNALLKIINDILDFSKIEAGKMEFETEPVDIREIVEDVSALLRTTALDKGLELRTNCAQNVPGIVRGDGGRIRQVLVNLVGNAIKFTETGSVQIDVSCDNEDEFSKVILSVTDTGIGIPEDKIAGVFDKFSQADGSMTRRYGGTGLGLAISKSLVVAMDGEIGLNSKFGNGSKFYFTLNLPIIEKAAGSYAPSLHNETKVPVLVITGDEANRCRIVKNLTKWGVQTVSAGSGKKALEALSKIAQTKFQFPLIILDNQLTDIRGFQIIEQLSSSNPDNRTPVIFVRSPGASQIEDMFLVAKADRSLDSSFSDQDLKQAAYDLLLKRDPRSIGPVSTVEEDANATVKLKSSAA